LRSALIIRSLNENPGVTIMEFSTNRNGTADPAVELHDIVGKAEDLLGKLGDSGEASITELRQRVNATLSAAKDKLGKLQSQAQDAMTSGAKNTDAYVRANPWTAVAVAAGVGALVGILVSRRI
jgi:ElaB/YqjD/DUF883 family membrane-anchored ribosome-binding protein